MVKNNSKGEGGFRNLPDTVRESPSMKVTFKLRTKG